MVYPKPWTIVCERTGKVTPIEQAWFVYDRKLQKWVVICADDDRGDDYDLRADQVIGFNAIEMMSHITEKLWFDPDDFANAVGRSYRMFFE